MQWPQLILLTIAMALAVTAAPQVQQQMSASQQQPVASASTQTAQSREAPAYDSGYSAGFGGAGGAGGYSAASSGSAYGAPAYGAPAASSYGAPAQSGGYGGGGNPQAAAGGNTGYYYYYYPVQEQKEAASYHPPKENYVATDSYGIDPLGIIAVLAVAGLVIAGLALLFPGWAYVRSDENVYYRALQAAPSLMSSMSKEDFRVVTSLVLAAVEGEDCIDKIMCDASKLVKKVKKADSWLKMFEDMAPKSVSSSIKKLRAAMKKGDECSKTISCPAKKKAL